MALGHFQSHAVDSAGNVLAGATVTVTNELTGGLATLKSDYAGASSKANGAGFTTDSDGYFDFYTTGGFYKITVEKDGSSKTWRYVGVGTLSGYDLDILLNAKRKTVRAATTANITISTALNNADTLDGVTLATNDLVLVKDQTNKYENGIYVVGVTPARHSDFDTYNEHVGAWIAVSEGTTNANRLYVNTDNQGGTLDTTEINFTRVIPNGGSAPLDSPAFTGSFQWTGDITPTSLSADQDDYNPSGLSGAVVIRQATTALFYINGLQGGSDGRVIIVKNAGSYPLVIGAEKSSSTAAYRFGITKDYWLAPGEATSFIYDSTSSRWVLLGANSKPEHIEVTPDPFPTVPHKPTVFADWATMPWLDRYFTFTRASIGTYYDRKGILRTAASGVPRFSTIYSSGESGLLIEGGRTNLYLRSEDLSHATYGLVGASVSANAATAPDGTSTADKLVENSANSTHLILQDATTSNATDYVFSFFAKAAERTQVSITIDSSGVAFAFATFNLSTGVVASSSGTNVVATIEALPNGWYRCTAKGTTTSTNARAIVYLLNGAGALSYTGDGSSGAYLWGWQLEAGSFASSYIPTTSSSVTRAADALQRSNADAFINKAEFSVFCEFVSLAAHASSDPPTGLAMISEGVGNNLAVARYGNVISGLDFFASSGGATQADTSSTSVTDGTAYKAAFRSRVNDFAGVVNAGTVLTDTAYTIPNLSASEPSNILSIATTPASTLIKRIAVFARGLTNAQLQTVTT